MKGEKVDFIICTPMLKYSTIKQNGIYIYNRIGQRTLYLTYNCLDLMLCHYLNGLLSIAFTSGKARNNAKPLS